MTETGAEGVVLVGRYTVLRRLGASVESDRPGRLAIQAAEAAVAFGAAGAVQSQLNFTRDNEREADRVGLQILDQAGFDPRGMAGFFERLQRATRLQDSSAPSYLPTHNT